MLVLYLDDTATVFPRAFYQRVQSSWHTCGVVLRFSDHHNKEAYWCHVNRGEATNRKCLFNSFALSGRGAILCVSLVFGSSPVFLLCTLKGWKNLITHTERNHTESLHGFLTGYNTGCECVHSHSLRKNRRQKQPTQSLRNSTRMTVTDTKWSRVSLCVNSWVFPLLSHWLSDIRPRLEKSY